MFLFRSIYIFVAIAYVQGLSIEEYFVDQGDSIRLPCGATYDGSDGNQGEVMWVRDGRKDHQGDRLTIQPDGSLVLRNVNKNDTGLYSCFLDNAVANNGTRMKTRVKVRTPPPALSNVSVNPSTILVVILWELKDNGGYPIIDFTAQYRLANSTEEWISISPNHISPNSRQIDVYKLEPNTTYSFRIWATNQLGPGEITEIQFRTSKVYEESELVKHFLAGAETFDTRVWVAAVGIVMGTLTVLGIGTCYLLYLECRTPSVGVIKKSTRYTTVRTILHLLMNVNENTEHGDDQEIIELVPNIILNPGFEDNTQLLQQYTEHIPADENSNNETTIRLNNNTVVQPRNV